MCYKGNNSPTFFFSLCHGTLALIYPTRAGNNNCEQNKFCSNTHFFCSLSNLEAAPHT